MVRIFPRDRSATTAPRLTGRRLVGLVAVLGLLASVLSLQAVSALGADEDTLKWRKSQVGRNLREAKGDLGHSSTKLLYAVRALERAEQKLGVARRHLQSTRVELAAAAKHDREMQAKLDEAERQLAEAERQLREKQEQLDEQRAEVAAWAASTFQSNDAQLLELRVLLNAQSPETLTTQMDAVDSVNDKNADRFDRLTANEVLLEVTKDEVKELKDLVAKQRADAARNLEVKKQLEAQAAQAESAVTSLVIDTRKARRAAEAAKAADRRQVAELEADRAKIEGELAAIAARRAAERARQQSAGPVSSGGYLDYPIDSYITSPYGMRFHPILHTYKLHDGTDFGGGCGTPIRAAAAGTVIQKYYNGGYGNRLILDHWVQKGVSLSTSYNHLSGYSASVGENVRRGEIIGYVGTTGYSTGCHLHFMVYENGSTVDPMSWL